MRRSAGLGIAAFIAVLGVSGCAGTPPAEEARVVAAAPAVAPASGERLVRARLDPDEVVCRKLPPVTGSRLSKGKETCMTRADWQMIEDQAKSNTRAMQEGAKVSLDKSD